MQKKRIIYTHIGLSSFVVKDIEILKSEFDVIEFYFKLSRKSNLPVSFCQQFFNLLIYIWRIDCIVIQFAGYQSYLPTIFGKIFRRKVIIILGGTDTVSFPSIQYGCFYNKKLKKFTSESLARASLLLPVSETLVKYEYNYTENDFPYQGYLFHAPQITTPYKVIYNGYDQKKWPYSAIKQPNTFITIAADLGSRFGFKLKGIDLIVEIAHLFPDFRFYIVGGSKINKPLPSNIYRVDNIANNELPQFISDKQFYLQLSMSEGFPNALCESMLCGCVPIVSNVGAMPFIIGETGYILMKKDKKTLSELITKATTEYSEIKSLNARERISAEFPLEKRRKLLCQTIMEHINHSDPAQ